MESILIIIPCLNEAERVGTVVGRVRAALPGATVLVVDDGSQDGTSRAARAADAEVITLPVNLGIGGAVQAGYRFAARYGFEYAVQVDGDGQHPPSEIERLLAPLRSGSADMTIGSRYAQERDIRQNVSSASRVIGSRILSRWLFILTGATVTDPTSGFRAVGRPLIERFAVQYPRDYPEPVSALWAVQRGWRVCEVPVTMAVRSGGRSSIRNAQAVMYMIKVLWSMLLDRVYRSDYANDHC